MIEIKDKSKCCGCYACEQKCPKHCITMSEDYEGFIYPHIDLSLCIDCGLCNMVCPIDNNFMPVVPINVYAAYNNNEGIRMKSSSGGIFTLLAEKTISDGGVVFGARFDSDWNVVLDYADTMEGVATFRGSKYVQAGCEQIYKKCEYFLKEGRKVLFSGTPCHIAALKLYLRKEYSNLLTSDVVCHGVPSPGVWNRYLRERVGRFDSISNNKVCSVNFRDKVLGWKQFHLSILTSNGSYCKKSCNDAYMNAFSSNLILRPSCFSCPFRGIHNRQSDISIADFWGVDKLIPKMDDDKGTSLIIINTEKGNEVINLLDISSRKVDINDASMFNSGLWEEIALNRRREHFFRKIQSSSSLIKQLEIHTLPDTEYKKATTPVWKKIVRIVKTALVS